MIDLPPPSTTVAIRLLAYLDSLAGEPADYAILSCFYWEAHNWPRTDDATVTRQTVLDWAGAAAQEAIQDEINRDMIQYD